MATNKPKTKYDYLQPDDFFELISRKCNYLDKKVVKDVYYEIIRATIQELRHKGMVRFPDFGDFTLIFHKERWSMDVNTRSRILIPIKRTMKFEVCGKLKKYLQSL
jgi:nucleoid DNA-binding protein